MPSNCSQSPLEDEVGPPCSNRKTAKQATALEAVIQLHQNKQLDDHLDPTRTKLPTKMFQHDYWFPNWDSDEDERPQADEHSNKIYESEIRVPKFLMHCRPVPLRQCFLHIIWTHPKYAVPSIFRHAFCHQLMKSDDHYFGILTQKPWPSTLCDFPVYSDLGEIKVSLETNSQVLYFTAEHINEISYFHRNLFVNIMGAVRTCFSYDTKGETNGYFIVPLYRNRKTHKMELSWKTIGKKFPSKITKPTDEEIRNQEYIPENYVGMVVTPWYNPDKPFIVCELSKTVFLHSPFVSRKFKTYADYFQQKHKLISKRREKQPLLVARPITSVLDGIKPRPTSASEKTRRKTAQADTNTYLVPEFCFIYSFPSVFWYKAIILPSLLHRIFHLLVAEELREKLVREAQVGALKLPKDEDAEHFKINDQISSKISLVQVVNQRQNKVRKAVSMRRYTVMRENVTNSKETQKDIGHDRTINVNVRPEQKFSKDNNTDVNLALTDKCDQNNDSRISLVDVCKQDLMKTRKRVSLRRYELLHPKRANLTQPAENSENIELGCNVMTDGSHEKKYSQYNNDVVLTDNKCNQTFKNTTKILNGFQMTSSPLFRKCTEPQHTTNTPELATLKECAEECGPCPYKVLEALTLCDAQDLINLERLETLGDSCLKYLVSVSTYMKCTDMNEGHLTTLRSQLVCNKNLFYCGKKLEIGSYIKATNFSTKTFWCPPGFSVPPCFQSSPRSILTLNIPVDEQFTGKISAKTIIQMDKTMDSRGTQINGMDSQENVNVAKEIDFLLGRHKLMRKNISDVLEALLGVYLQSLGIKGALKLLKYFGILKEENLETMFDPTDDRMVYAEHHMSVLLPGYENIERICNYKFENKAYLLEAFTHPSYSSNSATECYQKLEFLGDAVLDFLITSYIYEYCGNLDPGQLTDLRSSLVNNNTFGSLTVRLNLHKYMLCGSDSLLKAIQSFEDYQREKNYSIQQNELMTLINESDVIIAEEVEVPKALGDIFESLAGAVFLDSGCNLSVVWRIYYEIMKKEIGDFSKNVPINPIRALYEKPSLKLVFSATEMESGERNPKSKANVSLKVTNSSQQTREYIGRGENLRAAKRAAAKHALRNLSGNDTFIT